jgi:hypothetical protein
VSNDDPKEVATLRAFERPHRVPSGNWADPYYDPFDIASDAPCLGIHRVVPLVVGSSSCLAPAVNASVNFESGTNPGSCVDSMAVDEHDASG